MSTRKVAARVPTRRLGTLFVVALATGTAITVQSPANAATAATAATYYVSQAAAASDLNSGLTPDQPWRSLEKVNDTDFSPGDTIRFERGSTWQGRLEIDDSGTDGAPVTVTGYGSASTAPHFTNPGPHNAILVSGRHVTIDGVFVSDADYGYTQLFGAGPQDSGGAILFTAGTDHGVVRNSEFTGVGDGVKLFGSDHLVTRNYFHDLRLSFQGFDPMFGTTSYGAIGVAVKGSRQEVSYNRFVNCRAPSNAYGHDGGAIEVEAIGLPAGTNSGTNIHHNRSTGAAGFLEIDRDDSFVDSTVAYNVVDDYQDFLLLWNRARVQVVNNTVIRARYDGADSVNAVFKFPSDPTGVVLANNIFVVDNGLSVLEGANPERRNNLYWSLRSGTDPVGGGLATGERIADPRFIDYAGRDLHLSADSPAIDAGTDVGLNRDFDDQPVVGAPDLGAYEYQGDGSAASLIADGGFEAQSSADVQAPWRVDCNGGNTGVDRAAGKAHSGANNGWTTSSTDGWCAFDQTVQVTAGTTYRLVAHVRTSANFGARGYLGTVAPGIGKKEVQFATSTQPYSSGYDRVEVTFTATEAGASTVFVGMAGGDPSGSWLQVDDVQLTSTA